MPSSVKEVGKEAFYENEATYVVLNNGLEKIDTKAFAKNNIKNIEFPSSLTHIGEEAFYQAINSNSLNLNDGLETIGIRAFSYCRCSTLNLPDSVTTIKSSAFYECGFNGKLKIGPNVKIIENSAFVGNNFEEIDLTDSQLTSISSETFNKCKKLVTLKLPDQLTSIGSQAFGYCEKLEHVTFGNKVEKIGYRAFISSGLTEVKLPCSVEEIGEGVFRDCKISKVDLSACENLTKISKEAFYDNQLSSVIIPKGVSCIGDYAFYSNVLTNVELPSTLMKIDKQAFADNSLRELALPEGLEVISERTFENNNIDKLIIPNGSGLSEIGDCAFFNNRLSEVSNVPACLVKLSKNAFIGNQSALNHEGSPIWSDANPRVLLYPADSNVLSEELLKSKDEGYTYLYNPGIVIVSHVRKDDKTHKVANDQVYFCQIGDEIQVKPINHKFFETDNTEQTVKVKSGIQEIEFVYSFSKEYDPEYVSIDLSHSSRLHRYGLENFEWSYRDSFDRNNNFIPEFRFNVDIEYSANVKSIENPWIAIDLNTPYPTSYVNTGVEPINMKDTENNIFNDYYYDKGVLYLHISQKPTAGTKLKGVFKLTFNHGFNIPSRAVLDLTGKAHLFDGNPRDKNGVYLTSSSSSIDKRVGCRVVGATEGNSTRRNSSKVDYVECNGKKYAAQEVDTVLISSRPIFVTGIGNTITPQVTVGKYPAYNFKTDKVEERFPVLKNTSGWELLYDTGSQRTYKKANPDGFRYGRLNLIVSRTLS